MNALTRHFRFIVFQSRDGIRSRAYLSCDGHAAGGADGLDSPDSAIAPVKAVVTARAGRNPHVVLISPPGLDRELYASALEKAGFDVRQADTVESVATGSTESDVALIVMDLLPTPATAWDFIEVKAASRVPIVLFTPLIRPDRANRRRARLLGCAAFVAKPCSVRQLVAVVTRVHLGERGLEISTYSPEVV